MNLTYKHEWYLRNKSRVLRKRKVYRQQNLELIRKYDRKRNALRRKNPAYIEQWGIRAKEWVSQNRDKINAKRRANRVWKPVVRKTKEELAIKARLRNRKYYYKHKKRDKNCMKERDFGILFRHWIKANPQVSGTYELKDTRDQDSFAFSAWKEHQVDYALAIKSSKGTLMRVQGVNGEPDYVYFRNAPAYVVIRYPKMFCIIPVEKFIKERDSSKRKSLTSERAKEIAKYFYSMSPLKRPNARHRHP